ncbi:membrane protein [Porphyromonas crevioricanis]|uniref:Membrane protein n=2 Tax=Porphyromonas crevioricanis TaxID=393921 RepID=A0A0A2FT32_9PORP|nr:type IX secretion system outer membrane channel protein PorV [Porphyromonas crevioricanis]KGN88685.1 membrane protein [Porphyromonas crevioricanis]KGN93215.1 membrane protein [Porphyromonas crevioricanis]SJZ97588.1 hypothetical protein SAMN02745203_01465 [Porphyromonas crevioricanis]SQH73710.1 Uncharacterised protein [Porphyromonas crevioricanis]
MNKIFSLKSVLSLLVAVAAIGSIEAQNLRTVYTAVPSMQISPDAKAAGMGDQGTSTTPDPYSQFWNLSKYSFMQSKAGVSISYTPWLSKLVNDIYLVQGVGYYMPGQDANQAISASLRYFSLGKLTTFDDMGNSLGDAQPNEFAIDLGYSRQLSESFSMGVALRYIQADRSLRDGSSKGTAFAADVAGFLHKYVMLGDAESLYTFGFNIKNIGTKISFGDNARSSFIPTSLNLGTGLLYPLDEYNTIGFNVEANKLLVPTPPHRGDMTDEEYQKQRDEYRNTSSIAGIFKSFSDAHGGFKEEFQEVNWSLGMEYSYDNRFFIRTGYHYQHPDKGNLSYFTAGAGFKMNVFRVDASYLISTVQNNPLDQTLRFTLAFDMDGISNLLR